KASIASPNEIRIIDHKCKLSHMMNLFTGYFPKQSFGGRRIPSSGFHLLASKDARIGVIGKPN
ncbi:MAG TPA: hypothetical protein PL160_04975, partial [Candidatus Cloacimonas sp.]|nr:hypothetical protein [Candidatus Cloacimonas sp.]